MKKATFIAMQLLVGAAVFLFIGCSTGAPTASEYGSTSFKSTVDMIQDDSDGPAGTVIAIDYAERVIKLEKSDKVIVVTRDAKLIVMAAGAQRELRFEEMQPGMTASFEGFWKDEAAFISNYVTVSDTFEKADSDGSPAAAKLTAGKSADQRHSVAGIIVKLDADQRIVTLERSEITIVVTRDAKIVGDPGNGVFRFGDLREGLTARFEGIRKDDNTLVADLVEISERFTPILDTVSAQ